MQFIFARLAFGMRAPRAALTLLVLVGAVLTGGMVGAAARSVDQTQAVQSYESTPDQVPFYSSNGLEQSVLKPRVPRPQVSTDDKKFGVDRNFDCALEIVYARPLDVQDHVEVRQPVPHGWRSRAPPFHAV